MEDQNHLPWIESDHEKKYNENNVMFQVLVRFPFFDQGSETPFPSVKKVD